MFRLCFDAIFKTLEQNKQPSKTAQTPRESDKSGGCFINLFNCIMKNQEEAQLKNIEYRYCVYHP